MNRFLRCFLKKCFDCYVEKSSSERIANLTYLAIKKKQTNMQILASQRTTSFGVREKVNDHKDTRFSTLVNLAEVDICVAFNFGP